MALDITSPNTGASLAAQGTDAQRKLWKRGVELFEQTHDFFQQMEGKSARSIIRTETDTSKGQGQKISFSTQSGFYGEGKMGDELFESSSDFEEVLINDYEMTVDFVRNSSRWTARAEEWMGMRGELKKNIPAQLGEWMGRRKTDTLFMMFNKKLNNANYIYANGKGSADELVAADVLNYEEIVGLKTQMQRLGGKAALLGKTRNGNPVFRNCVVATSEAVFSLKMDPDYKQILREAGSRGDINYIFEGGVPDLDGQCIKEYVPIDHDGDGPIGSPLNPKALLGNAIAADDEVPGCKGGGSATAAAKTGLMFFKHFPKYAYKWLPSDIYDPAGDANFYILIVNPPGGANGNKIGMYEVSANNGNQLTIVKRLRAADEQTGDNISFETIGDVTWDTGVWEGLHTDSHPIGSTIILCNAKGQPYGHTHMYGAGAAYRGYGMYRNHRSTETHNGGFVNDTYITSVFGQEPRQNRRGICPSAMVLTHAVQYAGLPVPTVV